MSELEPAIGADDTDTENAFSQGNIEGSALDVSSKSNPPERED